MSEDPLLPPNPPAEEDDHDHLVPPGATRRHANRAAAMQFLYTYESNRPERLEDAMQQFFGNLEKPRDYYAFAEQLVCGALQQLDASDAIIRTHATNWAFHRIAKVDLAILRLALFELLHREDIPPIVSINEAIDLSKEYSSPDSKRFVNGILDKVKESLHRPLRTASE